jgi:hypothetical protein
VLKMKKLLLLLALSHVAQCQVMRVQPTGSVDVSAANKSSAQSTLPSSLVVAASVLSIPGTVCDGVTDVSPAVNALVSAGHVNVIIPANCIYYPTGGVTPRGVAIIGEDARSSVIAAKNPATTELYVGPYGSVENIGVIDQFCQVSAKPFNKPKTCPIVELHNQSSTNASLAVWVGNGLIYNCGPEFTTPDAGESVATDIPCISVNEASIGGDGIYAASTNKTSFGTSAMRVVTAGVGDNGIYLINGYSSPATRHYGMWAQDYDNG